MKQKFDKNSLPSQKQVPDKKIENKMENKNEGKLQSSKNIVQKSIASIKSQKDLGKKILMKEEKNMTGSSIVVEIGMGGTAGHMKTQSKVVMDREMKNGKQEVKGANSSKLGSQISPKGEGVPRFLFTKNSTQEKNDENLKKLLVEQDQKLKLLEKTNLQLERQVHRISQEMHHKQQMIEIFKTEKQDLQKNLCKLKNVSMENKKLLKEKADRFNSGQVHFHSLKTSMKDENQKKKSVELCEIGISTQLLEGKIKVSDNRVNGIEKLSHCRQVYSNKLNISDSKHEARQNCNELNGFSSDSTPSIKTIKSIYQQIITQKNTKLQQRQQLIYQQQCQLNDFYQQKQHSNKNIQTTTTQPNQKILNDVQQIYRLKNLLMGHGENQRKMSEDMREKDRQIQNLKRQIKIQGVVSELTQNNKTSTKYEIEKLGKQVSDLKNVLENKESRIKQLEKLNQSQEMIIKGLKESKPKVIVK